MGKIGKRLYVSLESKEGFVTALILSLSLFILIYYLYLGLATTPEFIKDSDSLDYHIPIANSILEHGFFRPPDLNFGLGYYPGVGESILSLFMRVGLPLNLFNLFALVLLFYLGFKLAESWGLNKYESLVFSFSISSLNSVLRLVLNQTIDIWLAVFFVWALYLFNKFKDSFFHYFYLGCSIGLLIGVKYSGILFALVLVAVFWKKLPEIKVGNTRKLLAFLIPFFIFGLSWYLRNYILTGNPIFPGKLLDFPSHPNFSLQDSNTLLTILRYPAGFWLFIQALISEYLIWALAFFSYPFLFILFKHFKKTFRVEIRTLTLIGFLNFLIYLILPSWPGNIISDLRYAFVAAIPSILAVFLLAKDIKKVDTLVLISLLCSISVITQFSFRPKIIFIWIILMIFVISLRKVSNFKK